MAISLPDLEKYVARVRSNYIDVDGAFGAQCWDQWSHYAMWVGADSWPTYTNAGGEWPHSGYACNVFHNARTSGITKWFDILPASATPRPGDVAFWDYGSAFYPWSHVATVLSVPRPGMLRCLTQNPGAVQIADLVDRGLIGYLRPKNLTVGNVLTSKTKRITRSEKEEANMNQLKGIFYMDGKTYRVALFNVFSGFFSEYTTTDATYNSGLARGLGAGSYTKVTKDHFNQLKADCTAVRTGRA